jgi:Holliday junction resolvase RusA-like endonuclease
MSVLQQSLNGHLEGIRLVTAIGGLDHDVHSVILDGAPYSKSRPRFSRNGNTYVPKKDRIAEKNTAAVLRMHFLQPMTGNVALACIFYRPNFQRIDVDNMLKHICDAANKIIWHDDSQVTGVVGIAEHDAEDPRTILAVAPHISSLVRGTDADYPCIICGTTITRAGQSGKLRQTCSRECAATARGHKLLDQPVPCAWCDQPFKRVSSYRKYCSPECRAAAFRDVRRAASQPPMPCASCGKPLTHRRGGRCRECWIADPKGNQLELPLGGVS